MRSSFSHQEIEQYRTSGFLTVPDFLGADELDEWRGIVDAAVAGSHRELTGKNSEKAFTQRMHLRRESEALAGLVLDPRIGSLVAELEGLDEVRLYLDQALIKEPYGAPDAVPPRHPLVGLLLATCLHHLGRPRRLDPAERLSLLRPGEPRASSRLRGRSRPRPWCAVRGASGCGEDADTEPPACRRLQLPQRPHGPRSRGEHDPGASTCDDGCLHARRSDLQRPPGRRGAGRGVPRDPHGGRPARRRRRDAVGSSRS